MHYLIVPKGSEVWAPFVRWINVLWTVLSRETMRMSANPQNIFESFVAGLVTVARVFFNYFYWFFAGFFILVVIFIGLFNRSLVLRKR
jgi:hypothetical protein